jgi:hypothetical protein
MGSSAWLEEVGPGVGPVPCPFLSLRSCLPWGELTFSTTRSVMMFRFITGPQ